MSWHKKEFKNEQEIKDAIEYWEMFFFWTTDSDKIDEMVKNIQKALTNNPVENPFISYSYYLIFEAVVLRHIFRKTMINNPKIRLPLWCFNNRSRNLENALVYSREYYESYLSDSDLLDEYGTMGELEFFINNIETIPIFIKCFPEAIVRLRDDEPSEWDRLKRAILNPNWSKDNESKRWNRFYSGDDWQHHEVFNFSPPSVITLSERLKEIQRG